MMRTILIFVAAASFLAGCITSESSGRANSTPVTKEDASDQNYQLGARYYGNGSYELARDRLTRATELNPKNANAHSMLGLTYSKLGNSRLATENFERAVKIAPDNFDVRNAYAIYLCDQNDFDEAREQFDRAIRVRENDNAEIMMSNAGVCMSKKPDYEAAEKYFRDALETRPTYGEALIQLAALKHTTGEHLTARAFVQRYLAVNETSSAVLYLALQIEDALDDERAATDYSNQLLRDFPDSREAQILMRDGM